MPVTAKLSKRFYEQLGDDVTNELVAWFNSVDATYRSDLRDLNEINFGRFDAKVEQRFAESDARLERRFAEFEVKWEKRFIELDANVEKRFTRLEAKWEARFTELDAKVEKRMAQMRVELHEVRSDLIKWMFAFWVTTLIAQAGLLFAFLRR